MADIEFTPDNSGNDMLGIIAQQLELIEYCRRWIDEGTEPYDDFKVDCIKAMTTAFRRINDAQDLIRLDIKQMRDELKD